jgi:pSer/pThr/pTyr-binding forkhead associated (FHA) protein
MARLYVKYDDTLIGEYPISNAPVTIGRLPDNTIHLDDIALSGRHARIVKENGHFVLYDENSTNGTYLNGHKVSRAVLTKGDVVHIARHSFAFSDEGTSEGETPEEGQQPGPFVASAPPPRMPGSVPVVESEFERFPSVNVGVPKSPPAPVAIVQVFTGKTDKKEYRLTAPTTVIGKGEAADIRLERWFAPKLATTITLRNGKYYIAESQTQLPVRVNSEVVRGERELTSGDTILVDQISLLFNLKP